MGALSTTWDEHYRTPFGPLVPECGSCQRGSGGFAVGRQRQDRRHHRSSRSRARAASGRCRQEFAAAINKVCSQTGALLIADEVQCGLGRTGQLFYFPALGLHPDLISVGKALGGGVPMGAALVVRIGRGRVDRSATTARHTAATRWPAARHWSVSTRSTAACSITCAASVRFSPRLRALQKKHPVDRRGSRRRPDVGPRARPRSRAPVVPAAALERGLIVNRTAENVVRLLPPLRSPSRRSPSASAARCRFERRA